MNAPFVQKSSVAAPKIDQPKFADILQVDKRVPARHFGRVQHDRVSGGPSEGTTALDRMACAIGRFQPGTFLWGGVHAETFYQEVIVDAKSLNDEASVGLGSISNRRCRVALLAFNFLPSLMLYTCSK